MSATEDGIVHWDVTRAALIDALGNHPLGEHLTLEARGKFADRLLDGMPALPRDQAAPADMLFEQGQMAGVRAERRRAAQLAAEIGAMCTGCDAFRTFADMLREQP